MLKIQKFIPSEGVVFSLTEEQVACLNIWHKDVHQRAISIQSNSNLGKRFIEMGLSLPHYGAIGGALVFSFSATSLGVVCKVKEAITGEEIDLTEYESW